MASRNLQSFPALPGSNSLNQWTRWKNPVRVIWNFLFIWAQKYSPSLGMKRWLLRRTGMRVAKNAAVGLCATFDIFYPELIELGEDCLIGYNCTIVAHEFLPGELRTGKVKVGARSLIGANSTILPGVTIGEGATISAMSLVNSDIPVGEFWGGVPARKIGERV